MAKYIGYHGTTKNAAKQIVNQSNFKVSAKIDDWLGTGVYFFENDCKQAYNFVKKGRRVADASIIKATLEPEFVFDLLLTEAVSVFTDVHNKILPRLIRMYGEDSNIDNYNGLIINYICANSNIHFDMVRGVFPTPKKETIEGTTITPSQIQLCVRKLDCIKNIKEVSCNDERKLPRTWKVLV